MNFLFVRFRRFCLNVFCHHFRKNKKVFILSFSSFYFFHSNGRTREQKNQKSMDLDDLLLNPENLSADKIVLLVHRVRTLEIQLAAAKRREDEMAAFVAERNCALDHMQGHVNELRLQLVLAGAGVSFKTTTSSSSPIFASANTQNSSSSPLSSQMDPKHVSEDSGCGVLIQHGVADDEKSAALYQEMCGLCVSGEHAVGNAGRFGRRGSLSRLSSARTSSQSPQQNPVHAKSTSHQSSSTNNGKSFSLDDDDDGNNNNNHDSATTIPPPPPCGFIMKSSYSSSSAAPPTASNFRQQQHPHSATVTPTKLLQKNSRSPALKAGADPNNNNNSFNNNNTITNSPFSLSARSPKNGVLPPTPPSFHMGGSNNNNNNNIVSSNNDPTTNNNPRLVRDYKRQRIEEEYETDM